MLRALLGSSAVRDVGGADGIPGLRRDWKSMSLARIDLGLSAAVYLAAILYLLAATLAVKATDASGPQAAYAETRCG